MSQRIARQETLSELSARTISARIQRIRELGLRKGVQVRWGMRASVFQVHSDTFPKGLVSVREYLPLARAYETKPVQVDPLHLRLAD